MELIQRTLKYKGNEQVVYFKELTAGQRLSLLKGQRIQTHPGEEKATIEIDLGENLERNQRLVQLTLVTAEGVQVYRTIGELQNEPDSKVRALVKIASDVHKDDDDEGNA